MPVQLIDRLRWRRSWCLRRRHLAIRLGDLLNRLLLLLLPSLSLFPFVLPVAFPFPFLVLLSWSVRHEGMDSGRVQDGPAGTTFMLRRCGNQAVRGLGRKSTLNFRRRRGQASFGSRW